MEITPLNKKIKLAVNGGISFGAKLNAKQLAVIIDYMSDSDELDDHISTTLHRGT